MGLLKIYTDPTYSLEVSMELLIVIITLVLIIMPLWRICTRAGFNGALSLLALIPWPGVIIVGAILSFAKWPAKAKAIKE